MQYTAAYVGTSFILGRILMTSPPRVLTTMLQPTASMTSTLSTFLNTETKGSRRIQPITLNVKGMRINQ